MPVGNLPDLCDHFDEFNTHTSSQDRPLHERTETVQIATFNAERVKTRP